MYMCYRIQVCGVARRAKNSYIRMLSCTDQYSRKKDKIPSYKDTQNSYTDVMRAEVFIARSLTLAFSAVSAPPRIALKAPPEGGIRLTTP